MTIGDPRRALVWKALLEVILISTGVFIGLAAEQWRSDRQHRDQATAALERFKAEIETNQAAVKREQGYHARIYKEIKAHLDPKTRATTNLKLEGIRPVVFEHTAWDLAIATQALADLDQSLAFELARVYGQQQQYTGLSNGITQAMYLRPPSENFDQFLHSLRVYYDDVVLLEPTLLEMYGRVLPMIESALRD